MVAKRRKHSAEFKAEIVKLVRDGGQAASKVSQAHNLSESLVYHWIRKADAKLGIEPNEVDEKEELSRLRKKVRELERERDFFRQATAYFAAEQK